MCPGFLDIRRLRQRCTAVGGSTPIADVLSLHESALTPVRLDQNLGDGVLCLTNPYFSSIRTSALERGFRFSPQRRQEYSGWPLVALDQVLTHRIVPYTNNYAGLSHLERCRPGFFRLRDLKTNRPNPNYVLHEGAHAVAYHELMGSGGNAFSRMKAQESALPLLLSEAFAMTAEYFAACATSTLVERWFFSINSYRQRVPAKSAVANHMRDVGETATHSAVLCAFLRTNYLKTSITRYHLDRLSELLGHDRTPPAEARRLARALSEAMKMEPGFLRDTSRIFLCSLGYPRSVLRTLERSDPLDELAGSPPALGAWPRLLCALWAGEP